MSLKLKPETFLVEICSYEQICYLVSVSGLPFFTDPVGNVFVHPFAFQLHHSCQPGFGSQPQSFLARAELTIKVGSLRFANLKNKKKHEIDIDLNIYLIDNFNISNVSSKLATLAWRDGSFFSDGSRLLGPAVGSCFGVSLSTLVPFGSSVFLSAFVFSSSLFGF